MNVLELFSGTGSVGKVCKEIGWNVVSVDLELPATHECDVMDFDYKQYSKDYFSVIWASPPCTNYSTLKKCSYGRKLKDGSIYTKEQHIKDQDEADKLVLKSLEIINYFNPEIWFMENPQTGNLKNREIVKGLSYYDVDYCMYSDWGYRKRTRIWTNKKDFNNLLCDGSGACGNMIEIPTQGAVRHDSGKPLKCETRKLHNNLLCKSETLRALKAYKKHKSPCDGGYDKRRKKHKLNVANDVHTIGEKKGKIDNYGNGTTKLDRYRIPPDLIISLLLD